MNKIISVTFFILLAISAWLSFAISGGIIMAAVAVFSSYLLASVLALSITDFFDDKP